MNDIPFSKRSSRARQKYFEGIEALYGTEKCPALKAPTKRKVKRRVNPLGEASIQIKLVAWARNEGLFIHSIPNHGKRSYWTGQKEVAMGLLAGASDLFLAEPRGRYAGYYIELKSPGKELTQLQLEFSEKVKQRGYKFNWFDNFELAQEAIKEYIGLE